MAKKLFIAASVVSVFFTALLCCACSGRVKDKDWNNMGAVDWRGYEIGGTAAFSKILDAEELMSARPEYEPVIDFSRIAETGFRQITDLIGEGKIDGNGEIPFEEMPGVYISPVPEYIFDMALFKIIGQRYYLFDEDKEFAGYVQFEKSRFDDSATVYTGIYGSVYDTRKYWSYRSEFQDMKYITVSNFVGAVRDDIILIDDSNNTRYPGMYAYTVNGDYYHTLRYELLGVSFNDITAEEKYVWIDFR